METINNNWLPHFLAYLKDSEEVCMISPFITDNMVRHLLSNVNKKTKIYLITRYNLNDFKARVSSIKAIERLVENGVKIKGVRELHSKLYLFDSGRCIISSANFTNGGFFNNYEYGIKTEDAKIVKNSVDYFNKMYSLDAHELTIETVNNWKIELAKKKEIQPNDKLPDYGAMAMLPKNRARRYFIKFFGKNDSRVDLNFTSRDEIENAHCHFALTFSDKKGRPRRYQDGDVVYMAMMLYGGDYAIFGKGISLKHDDKRDVASDEDIAEVDWKEDWPIYIRVYRTEFIDSSMRNCPKMNELISDLDYDAFQRTKLRSENGEENINVRSIFMQHADTELSEIGAQWMENKFQQALTNFGAVPSNFLSAQYQGSVKLNLPMVETSK